MPVGATVLGAICTSMWGVTGGLTTRNEREFQRIARYIEMNPVNSGLAVTPKEFLGPAPPIANRLQV
jgi:hypothetical protein